MNLNQLFRYGCAILIIWLVSASYLPAQDSIRISLPSAEKQFLERNLQLLAEKYNIEIAKAQVIQAKLFDNPNFSASVDIYNPENYKWFDVSNGSGQYDFSVDQLIRLAGKRNKEISLAKIDVQLSENRFYELLRTLHFSLNSVFYDTYYTLRSLEAFDTQIELLEDLQKNYDELEKRGIVPLSEVVRIRSLLYGLRSDKLDLQNQFNDKQALLQLLLQDNTIIYIPEIDKSEFVFENPSDFLLPYLVNEAKENRIDLKTLQSEITYHNKNYSLQKAMAVPDITIGAEYDKRGSFADHIPLLTMSIDLPLFNRNQGNIKAAKASIKQSEIQFQQKQLEVENEVHKAYLNALNADKINNSIAPGFESDLQNILQNITENFKKRNISMLEFTDFYESYRDNVIHLNQIKNQKAQAMEELRFVVGTNIIQ